MSTLLQHAQIDWDDQGRPHSRQYDDVYFSKTKAPTKPATCSSNRPAWRSASPTGAHGCLVIGETGFGTGMNFFCAWQLFAEQAHADARLHFISVEKYPLGQ
jgi:Uncharacterized conserved protein